MAEVVGLEIGRRVLAQESAAVAAAGTALGAEFSIAIQWLVECQARVITCGIGKSGHIARKTAGTLSSTGTPSFFLHAAEAVHGDLGMVTPGDVVLLYTHSGETDEIVRLFPSLKAQGAQTILVTGRPNSSAGRLADLILDTGVREEACPNNLAPTTSTTVMLALSDALAVAVMEIRGFGREDFAKFHPSGTLGKRLLLRVSDVMRPLAECAVVAETTPKLEIMRAIGKAGTGAALVLGNENHLRGIVTEGDLRRHFVAHPTQIDAPARDFMTASPLTIEHSLLAAEALEVFETSPRKIGEMPALDGHEVVGILQLKDLLRSGIV
ncbi:MAG: KpsF/GutQ family sugar-phosphate isomerase [Fimbriimonas sp.]